MSATLTEQADEAELHAMGLADMIARARAGRIKRSPDAIAVMVERPGKAEAPASTLRGLAAAEKRAVAKSAA